MCSVQKRVTLTVFIDHPFGQNGKISHLGLSCKDHALRAQSVLSRSRSDNRELKGPFTRVIFVAIFLILTHAIEPLSHKSIDLNSFAQMV